MASRRATSEPAAVPGRFRGARVLVTGAASGIGRSISARMALEGATVVMADRDVDAAEAAAAEIATDGVIAAHLDQADESSVRDVVESAAPLDVVCANAGVAIPGRATTETTAEQWRDLHSINLEGSFLVARAAIPSLLATRGAIVFTASTSGLRAHVGAAAYAASKAGLIGFSRSLAAELAPHGVRVNCVCPGGVRTPLLREVESNVDLDASDLTPLGPLADPDDIAAAVSFLASPDARHITGIELVVDGGESAVVRRG